MSNAWFLIDSSRPTESASNSSDSPSAARTSARERLGVDSGATPLWMTSGAASRATSAWSRSAASVETAVTRRVRRAHQRSASVRQRGWRRSRPCSVKTRSAPSSAAQATVAGSHAPLCAWTMDGQNPRSRAIKRMGSPGMRKDGSRQFQTGIPARRSASA